MTRSKPRQPQLQVEQVSYAPPLFRAIKPKAHELIETGPALLQDVSFELYPGDRLAIVGASGAGKTTLLRLLNRLSEPTHGQLYWQGQPYGSIPSVQLRQQIVLLLQESKLLGMTVREAIAYPLKLRGLSSPAIAQRVAEWMERLRVPLEWGDRTEQQLSVGQRQLVAIVRALVTEPPILLCDEPTAALDVGRIEQVLQVLLELSLTRQMTVVMVNHQLDLAQRLASRVLHLEQGTVRFDQAVAQVDWAALAYHLRQREQEQATEWECP